MMKNRAWKRTVVLTAAGLVLTTGIALAEETSQSEAATEAVTDATDAAETEAVTDTTNAETTDASAAGLSDRLYDFQIELDGVVYQFPMTYADFVGNGWELNTKFSDDTVELEPMQYDMVYFTKDDVQCVTYVMNMGINNQPVADCLVGGVSIDNFDWATETGSIKLACGIERGVSTMEDITAAYGNPTDTYEGDLYTKLGYEKESYSSVDLYVYKESGVLEDIEMRNFKEPEGFDAGSASEEVPEDVTAYVAPDNLGTDLASYQVEFDGALYQLPCPVTALLENGWELDTDNTVESISANSSDWVYFIKGGNSFHILAKNSASYATIPENCWVEDLSAGDYGMDVSMRLPGGIELGTTEEELIQALTDAGLDYETEDGSSYRYYEVGEDSWNNLSFYVCTDAESTVYTPDTVYKIGVAHEK